MTWSELAKLCGIAGVLWSWIAGVLLFRRGNLRHRSISHHGAMTAASYRLFGLTMTGYGISFVVFCLGWLIPTYRLGVGFVIAMLAAAACQIAAGWIRDRSPERNVLHGSVAWTMAALMPVMLGLIIAGQVSPAVRVVLGLAITQMVITWFIFGLVRRARPYFLWYQGAYIVSFHLCVLATIFLR